MRDRGRAVPGFPEARSDTQDGVRLDWPEGWVHVRPSNTEPIYRTIGESADSAWLTARLRSKPHYELLECISTWNLTGK